LQFKLDSISGMADAFPFQCMEKFYLVTDGRIEPLRLVCVFDTKLCDELINGTVNGCFDVGTDELSFVR